LILSGKIALMANNPRSALSRAQSVLNSKSDHVQALHLMAHALEALQRPDEAIALLDKYLPNIKDPIPTQMEKLMLLYRARGLDAGLDALKQSVEQDDSSSPELLALLAQWLLQADQVDGAVQAARAALQADQGRLAPTQQAELYHLIGLNMKKTGQLDQALHALSQAAQLDPGQLPYFLDLAGAYQERREHHQAITILEQAQTFFPDDYRPFYMSGIVYKDKKEYVEAEKMLRLAVKIAPEEVSIHRLLGAVVALNLVHNR
jgi:tetratricopeptide (TPR) repeat protein